MAFVRAHLFADLAEARAALLDQLTGIDGSLLERSVFDDQTVANLLAHIASWDEFFVRRLFLVNAGREAEIVPVDVDERNAETLAERHDWSLDRALAAFIVAREELLAQAAQVHDDDFSRRLSLPWGAPSVHGWLAICQEHDVEHTADLLTWREALEEAPRNSWHESGPKSLLLASLQARRNALLASIALVPENERETKAISGEWTLRDIVGHIADWEVLDATVLHALANRKTPETDFDGDVDDWNAHHAAIRSGQSWETLLADLAAARAMLLDALTGVDDAWLNAPQERGRWSGPPYRWAFACIDHDREHTDDLRKLWPSAV